MTWFKSSGPEGLVHLRLVNQHLKIDNERLARERDEFLAKKRAGEERASQEIARLRAENEKLRTVAEAARLFAMLSVLDGRYRSAGKALDEALAALQSNGTDDEEKHGS